MRSFREMSASLRKSVESENEGRGGEIHSLYSPQLRSRLRVGQSKKNSRIHNSARQQLQTKFAAQ